MFGFSSYKLLFNLVSKEKKLWLISLLQKQIAKKTKTLTTDKTNIQALEKNKAKSLNHNRNQNG